MYSGRSKIEVNITNANNETPYEIALRLEEDQMADRIWVIGGAKKPSLSPEVYKMKVKSQVNGEQALYKQDPLLYSIIYDDPVVF